MKGVPWCTRCDCPVPLSEVHALAGGKHYIHLIRKPVTEIGFGIKNRQCGKIEWRPEE